MPPNLERLESDNGYYVSQNLMALRNTRIGNLMGICSLTIPTNYNSCGLSIMALPNRRKNYSGSAKQRNGNPKVIEPLPSQFVNFNVLLWT